MTATVVKVQDEDPNDRSKWFRSIIVTAAVGVAISLITGFFGSYIHQLLFDNSTDEHFKRIEDRITIVESNYKQLTDKIDTYERNRQLSDIDLAAKVGAVGKNLEILNRYVFKDGGK
jgi:hypothetical protein